MVELYFNHVSLSLCPVLRFNTSVISLLVYSVKVLMMFRVWTDCHLLVAVSLAYGGEDFHGADTALHFDGGAGQVTAGAASPPRPRDGQHCCHDNQLHPLLGAAQTLATRGDQVPRQIFSQVGGSNKLMWMKVWNRLVLDPQVTSRHRVGNLLLNYWK